MESISDIRLLSQMAKDCQQIFKRLHNVVFHQLHLQLDLHTVITKVDRYVGILIRSKHLSTFVQVQHLLIVGISHGRENTMASFVRGIRLLETKKLDHTNN